MMQPFQTKIVVLCCLAGLAACSGGNTSAEKATFTKIDSLTENYLALQDSMLSTWNNILKDENRKINSMHELLHALLASQQLDKAQLAALEQRLDQLQRIRLTQKTIANQHVIEEYDFASNSLIFEIVTLAESDPTFQGSPDLLHYVDNIKIADQRISIYRADYDSVTTEFNRFLEKNKASLKDLDQNLSQEKRPLFQMAEN